MLGNLSTCSQGSVTQAHLTHMPISVQFSVLAVVALGVANRVLYKMALTPLHNYVFFLAQAQTFGYVAVYFAALYIRYR